MRPAILGALVLLAACGVSEERFKEQYASESCELLSSCDDDQVAFADQADCEIFYGMLLDSTTASCDYSAEDASACLKAVQAASCDAAVAGVAACSSVYSGDGCAWGGASTATSTEE